MPRRPSPLRLFALAWSVLLAAAAGISIFASYENTLEHARVAARVAFEKDLTFRQWNSMRGGVYVLVNERNMPNPYLEVEDRDLRTDDGRLLTMINPAYMTRQAYDIQQVSGEVQGHITSLNPIRPENGPDPWEREALAAFAKGVKEVSDLTDLHGKPHMRIMRPVLVDAYCLKCHAKQGYKVGEIRGGISVSVPMASYYAGLGEQAARMLGGYGLTWAIGLVGIVLAGRRLEASLATERAARHAAEAASQAKDEFLANMSHEVRTPLNGMMGMLQLLKEGGPPEEQRQCLDMAYESSRRLLDLLNDVLDFSRMEAGGFCLASRPFSTRDLLDSVSTLFHAASARQGLTLAVRAHEGLPRTLVGDEARLRQLLFNLVGNAIKFTPQGTVQLESWARPDPRREHGWLLYLRVSDTGIGIPEDKLGLVFERFTQADGSFTRQHQGAGLGLAIVKRLVDLMQGSLCVMSVEGQGTEFLFVAPLEAPEDPCSRPGCPAQPGSQGTAPMRRLLLAEDEEISRLSMRALLTRQGFSVDCVENGRQALEALEREDYDCVLMDIQMPEMNGMEATLAIRAREQELGLPRMPVVAITAYAMPGDRERFLSSGVDEHVPKPVQLERLLEVLQRLARSRA